MAKHNSLDRYQKQTAQFRKDPAKSSAVSSHSQFRKNNMGLENLDEKRHYVGVYAQDQDSLARYEGEGYVVETLREGGPRYRGYSTAKEGEPVTFRGHILMSIDKEELAENIAVRQANCDAIQRKMKSKKDEDQRIDGRYGVPGVIVDRNDLDMPSPV